MAKKKSEHEFEDAPAATPPGQGDAPPGQGDTPAPPVLAGQEALLARLEELEGRLASLPSLDQARWMTRRIDELEGELEKAQAPTTAPAPAPEPGLRELRPIKVELEHGPTHVVLAVDEANAFEVYKTELGCLRSEYTPKCSPATHEEHAQAQRKRFAAQEAIAAARG